MHHSTGHALRTIALVLVGVLAVVACDGGDGDTAQDDTAQDDTAQDDTAQNNGQTEEGTGTVEDETVGGGSFVVGLPNFFVTNFAPGNTGGSYVDYALWTPLTQVDAASGELEMRVAKSIESDDQTTWTITLNDGWTFHDGSPVTAQSFADAWNAVADPANAFDNNGTFSLFEGYEEMNPVEGEEAGADSLSGLEVVDELTLSATLNEPNSLFPFIVSSTAFAPIPEGVEDFDAFATQPVGNGPFMMQDGGFSPDDQDVIIERYDDYAGTPAAAESVNLRIYVDPASIYTDFQAGAIDLALAEGSDLEDASTSYAEQLVEVPFPAMIYLAFPIGDERFADPEVRQAISRSIDRESIVQNLTGGFGTPSTGLAPQTMVGGGGDACEACVYDPEAAATQLEEAGGFSGPLTMYTYQDPTNEAILEATVNQLRSNLGIEEITFEAQDISQLYDSLFAGTVDGPTLLYAGAVFPHLYALSQVTLLPGADLNVSGYDSEEFNALMDQAAAADNPDDTISLAQEAEVVALEDMPITPILAPEAGLVHAENLSGVIPEPLGGPVLAAVEVE